MIKFSKDIDIIGFLALFLSISSLSIHAINRIKGANIELLPLSKVIIKRGVSYQGVNLTEFSVKLTYINTANRGYNDFILQEDIKVSISGKIYNFTGSNTFEPVIEHGKVVKRNIHDTSPFIVLGASTISHYTQFSRYNIKNHNYIPWSDFTNLIKEGNDIKISIVSKKSNESLKSNECIIDAKSIVKVFDIKDWVVAQCNN